MPSLFSFWDRGRTKKVDRDLTEDASKEGESLLTPEQEDRLILHRTGAKQSAHFLVWIIVVVLSASATFCVGFAFGNTRREGPWGSFENGFIEERVVSKYQRPPVQSST